MTSLEFGPFGISTGLDSSPHSLEAAAAAEELGYPAIWLSGGPLPGLQTITDLVEATSTIKFVSGILSVDKYSATEVASAYAGLAAAAPGRFTVGLGGAHGNHPIATLNAYFDQLDGVPSGAEVRAGHEAQGGVPAEYQSQAVVPAAHALQADLPAGHASQGDLPAEHASQADVPAGRPSQSGVPVEHRLLAALGPRMLELARERTAGAFPFLITPGYTAEARRVLGPDKLLAVSHLVVLETDADRARAIARETISFFPTIPGYAASLKRQGFTEADLQELPDELVDSLAAWGTPTEITKKLREHHDAGANHVAINVITGVTGPQPIAQWRALAPALLS